jgi:antitoxin VapB
MRVDTGAPRSYLHGIATEVIVSAKAKLFTHGGSQAVRLPKAFRFEGKEVSVRKEGDAVILEPVKPKESLDDLWARLDAIRGDHQLEYPPRDDLIWPEPVSFDK